MSGKATVTRVPLPKGNPLVQKPASVTDTPKPSPTNPPN